MSDGKSEFKNPFNVEDMLIKTLHDVERGAISGVYLPPMEDEWINLGNLTEEETYIYDDYILHEEKALEAVSNLDEPATNMFKALCAPDIQPESWAVITMSNGLCPASNIMAMYKEQLLDAYSNFNKSKNIQGHFVHTVRKRLNMDPNVRFTIAEGYVVAQIGVFIHIK